MNDAFTPPLEPAAERAAMSLPAGKTCADCRHFKRTCEWLISCEPTRTQCDWLPSRFNESLLSKGSL